MGHYFLSNPRTKAAICFTARLPTEAACPGQRAVK